jgi:hypothetical protein
VFSASAYERRGADIYQPFNGENYAFFLRSSIQWSSAAQSLSVRIRESCVVHHWVVFDEQRARPRNTPQHATVGALTLELPAQQATDIKARCTPKCAADTPLIRTQPHIHARGVRLDTIVERAIGVAKR